MYYFASVNNAPNTSMERIFSQLLLILKKGTFLGGFFLPLGGSAGITLCMLFKNI